MMAGWLAGWLRWRVAVRFDFGFMATALLICGDDS